MRGGHTMQTAVNGAEDSAESRLAKLTDREREVLELVTQGMSNPDIAAHLCVTVGTAKGHVHSILTKLDARDRTQVVIMAYSLGLV